MKTSRRDFLRLVGTTAGGTLFLPKFLSAMPRQDLYDSYQSNKNTLVVIQLNGGNDGLNTFIPYDTPQYYDLRPTIAIPKDMVLKATGGMGWHTSMKGFYDIQQAGDLSVIQNVGYPNPNRSHFRSIEIWQTGSNSNEYLSKGWLWRYLDATCQPEDALGALNLDNIENLALRGQINHSLTMQDPQRFEKQLKGLTENNVDPLDENPNLDFVRKLMINSFEGSDQIKKALEKSKVQAASQRDGLPQYPKYGLAKNLEWMAKMIKGGLATNVYYTGLGSFDTHAGQLGKHKNLLTELSESVKAFYDDMKTAGLINNVTVMIFSEFGRRAKDNGSGTDHGTAAPVFIIGGGTKGQLIGQNPNFNTLENGDLKHQYDFRSVYATILQQKLNVNPESIGLKHEILRGVF